MELQIILILLEANLFMESLIELASNNSDFLIDWQANATTSKEHTNFYNLVEQTVDVSVNAFLLDCLEICDVEFVKSMYQVASEEVEFANEHAPHRNPYTVEDMLKARFRSFYNRRVSFDSMFEGYETFKYTALNLTSRGLMKYGDFCINFNRLKVQIVFLAKESLKYFRNDGAFDYDSFRREIALNDDLPKLALRKHFEEIENYTFSLEGACCETNYIEGIVVNDLTLNEVESINIDGKKYDAFFEVFFKRFTSEKLDEQEKIILRQFIKLNTVLKEKGLKLRKI